MPSQRRFLGVVGIALIAAIGSATAQPAAPASTVSAESPSTGTRVKVWTRSKLDAAKKRWAQNQEKFSDCQKQLAERQKVNRQSLRKQGRFLEQCMARKKL